MVPAISMGIDGASTFADRILRHTGPGSQHITVGGGIALTRANRWSAFTGTSLRSILCGESGKGRNSGSGTWTHWAPRSAREHCITFAQAILLTNEYLAQKYSGLVSGDIRMFKQTADVFDSLRLAFDNERLRIFHTHVSPSGIAVSMC